MTRTTKSGSYNRDGTISLMTKRWNVHHGNENLGLKTAKEIREALRKGTLDPFDKVSAEGSNIREDLIEVDEIFKETQEDEEYTSVQQIMPTADMTAVASRAKHQQQQAQPREVSPPKIKDPIPRGPDPQQPRTNAPPPAAVASPSWRTDSNQAFKDAGDSKDSKSTQKRYYLIDKSKILGPLSGLEIQSLFNRGLLNQKVKVQRIGGTRSIPVAQFISSYSEDRLKELTDEGKLNQKVSSPSSKVLNELARVANAQKIAKTRKNKTYLIILIAGLVLGALVFIIVDSSQPSSSSKRSEAREERENRSGSRPKLLQKSQNDREEEEEEEDRRPTRQPRPQVPVKQVTRQAPPPEIKRETPKATVKPTRKATVAAPAPTPAPKAAPVKVATRPVPAAAPAPTPAPAPVAPPKKVEKDSPIARAMSSSGRGIQTIGPLSFSMTSLESCPSKCTLTLRDASGASIKAVFFKSAYYDQLKKSSSSVFLTGNTRKESGELTIFIQDVR